MSTMSGAALLTPHVWMAHAWLTMMRFTLGSVIFRTCSSNVFASSKSFWHWAWYSAAVGVAVGVGEAEVPGVGVGVFWVVGWDEGGAVGVGVF